MRQSIKTATAFLCPTDIRTYVVPTLLLYVYTGRYVGKKYFNIWYRYGIYSSVQFKQDPVRLDSKPDLEQDPDHDMYEDPIKKQTDSSKLR